MVRPQPIHWAADGIYSGDWFSLSDGQGYASVASMPGFRVPDGAVLKIYHFFSTMDDSGYIYINDRLAYVHDSDEDATYLGLWAAGFKVYGPARVCIVVPGIWAIKASAYAELEIVADEKAPPVNQTEAPQSDTVEVGKDETIPNWADRR